MTAASSQAGRVVAVTVPVVSSSKPPVKRATAPGEERRQPFARPRTLPRSPAEQRDDLAGFAEGPGGEADGGVGESRHGANRYEA